MHAGAGESASERKRMRMVPASSHVFSRPMPPSAPIVRASRRSIPSTASLSGARHSGHKGDPGQGERPHACPARPAFHPVDDAVGTLAGRAGRPGAPRRPDGARALPRPLSWRCTPLDRAGGTPIVRSYPARALPCPCR